MSVSISTSFLNRDSDMATGAIPMANVNGGEINISGECDDSYAVGASFGGYIYINDGAVINVKATAGKAYAVAAIYSGSTVVLAKGSVVNLGDSNFNGLADIMSTSVFIDNRE